MRVAASIAALLIAGCTTATPINRGDGVARFHLDCGKGGMAKCYAKANEVCPAGYAVEDQNVRDGFVVMNRAAGSNTYSTMNIRCR